jgi:hypothetical protein
MNGCASSRDHIPALHNAAGAQGDSESSKVCGFDSRPLSPPNVMSVLPGRKVCGQRPVRCRRIRPQRPGRTLKTLEWDVILDAE